MLTTPECVGPAGKARIDKHQNKTYAGDQQDHHMLCVGAGLFFWNTFFYFFYSFGAGLCWFFQQGKGQTTLLITDSLLHSLY